MIGIVIERMKLNRPAGRYERALEEVEDNWNNPLCSDEELMGMIARAHRLASMHRGVEELFFLLQDMVRSVDCRETELDELAPIPFSLAESEESA